MIYFCMLYFSYVKCSTQCFNSYTERHFIENMIFYFFYYILGPLYNESYRTWEDMIEVLCVCITNIYI